MNERAAGFTLVEMVLATALAAMMMVAVLGVIASLGRTQQSLLEQAARGADSGDQALALLRFDLTHAHRLRADVGGAEMIGYGALDPMTLEPTHRPVRVVYRLVSDGEASAIVREQFPLDEPAAAPWRALVAINANGLTVRPVKDEPPSGPPGDDGTPANADNDERLPAIVEVGISAQSGSAQGSIRLR